MYIKKIGMICLVLVLICFFISFAPRTYTIDKTLSCSDAKTNAQAVVQITGVYHQFFWKDDIFEGSITLDGTEIATGTLHFQNDFSAILFDDAVNPKWLIAQFKQFSYISVVDNTRNIHSTWDPRWQTALEKQERFQKYLDMILPHA